MIALRGRFRRLTFSFTADTTLIDGSSTARYHMQGSSTPGFLPRDVHNHGEVKCDFRLLSRGHAIADESMRYPMLFPDFGKQLESHDYSTIAFVRAKAEPKTPLLALVVLSDRDFASLIPRMWDAARSSVMTWELFSGGMFAFAAQPRTVIDGIPYPTLSQFDEGAELYCRGVELRIRTMSANAGRRA